MTRTVVRTEKGTFARALTCDHCQIVRISGTPTHEIGCPVAWKDYKRECKNCGSEFTPESSRQEFCDNSCYCSYYGLPDPDDSGDGDLFWYEELGAYMSEAEAIRYAAEIGATMNGS
jgi:hypothetical protein